MDELGIRIRELEGNLSEISIISGILSEAWTGPAGELCVSELRKILSDTDGLISELRKIQEDI